MDLLEVTTAIRVAYREATPEEVLAEAADQTEAIYVSQREEREAAQPTPQPSEEAKASGENQEALGVASGGPFRAQSMAGEKGFEPLIP